MTALQDTELKAKHRAMWASGDYPTMVETFLLPLGPRLVEASGIGPGDRVLDVAAGTGNASLPAAERGAARRRQRPHARAARGRKAPRGRPRHRVGPADAEHLPFEDASFDVVMSSIGVMFAPHHQAAADELVRVCRPGGTIALLSWTPEGMIGAFFRAMKPSCRLPRPAFSRRRCGAARSTWPSCSATASCSARCERDMLDITAFEHPHGWGEHFQRYYGPTLAARANAAREGREDEFDAAVDAFCDEWNRGDCRARPLRTGVPGRASGPAAARSTSRRSRLRTSRRSACA